VRTETGGLNSQRKKLVMLSGLRQALEQVQERDRQQEAEQLAVLEALRQKELAKEHRRQRRVELKARKEAEAKSRAQSILAQGGFGSVRLGGASTGTSGHASRRRSTYGGNAFGTEDSRRRASMMTADHLLPDIGQDTPAPPGGHDGASTAHREAGAGGLVAHRRRRGQV